jgi:hypothetical protein
VEEAGAGTRSSGAAVGVGAAGSSRGGGGCWRRRPWQATPSQLRGFERRLQGRDGRGGRRRGRGGLLRRVAGQGWTVDGEAGGARRRGGVGKPDADGAAGGGEGSELTFSRLFFLPAFGRWWIACAVDAQFHTHLGEKTKCNVKADDVVIHDVRM